MSEQTIQPGKYVAVTYTIADEGGEVVERLDMPIGFVYGSDTRLIGGMEKAVAGKKVGDTVEVEVSPDEAFGAHDPGLTFTDAIENVPPEFHQIGAEVQMHNGEGETKTFHVTRIEDGRLTVDGNHPLAGKALTVRVTIAEVRDARPGEEQTSGIHAVRMEVPPTIN